MYRDRFTQWAQSAFDATVPETAESIARAKAAQREERAAVLQQLWDTDEPAFYRLLMQFLQDDPASVTVWSTKFAARVAVRQYRTRVQ